MQRAQSARPLARIKVGNRHRKDFGDIDGLARSIDQEGLLQPIAITPADELIAGERRIRAWARSKFRDDPIPVHVVDLDEIVRGEFAAPISEPPSDVPDACSAAVDEVLDIPNFIRPLERLP
jgi:hypothetical protein